MELVVPFVEAVALPATIIFLVLHFQEVVLKQLRSQESARQQRRSSLVDRPIVDIHKARANLKDAQADSLTDQELAERVRDCLVTRHELRLLTETVAFDGVSRLSSFRSPADQRAIQTLVAKHYLDEHTDGRYVLTDPGRRLLQSHLERMSRAQQA